MNSFVKPNKNLGLIIGGLIFIIFLLLSGCKKDTLITSSGSGSSYFLDGNGIDWPNQLLDLGDEGLIVAGYTTSTDLAHTAIGEWDGLVVRLTSNLDTIWTQIIGGTGFDAFTDIVAVDDGFILCGYKELIGQGKDIWIVKIDLEGAIVWESTMGGTAGDQAFGIEELTPNVYALSGFSSSTDAGLWGNYGGIDGLVFTIDNNGQLLWMKNLGGSANDLFTSLTTDGNGNIYVVGYTSSGDGDLNQNKGYNDFWYAHLTTGGNIVTSKTYGTDGDELGLTISYNNDLLLIAGARSPFDSLSGSIELKNWHMSLITTSGNLLWEESVISEFSVDAAFASCPTGNHGFLVAGKKGSSGMYSSPFLYRIDLEGNSISSQVLRSNMIGQTLSVSQNENGFYTFSASSCRFYNASNPTQAPGLFVVKE
jgi:hypothetical protein